MLSGVRFIPCVTGATYHIFVQLVSVAGLVFLALMLMLLARRKHREYKSSTPP